MLRRTFLILPLLILAACAPPAAPPALPAPPTTETMTPAPTPTEIIAGQPDPASAAMMEAAAESARQVAAAALGLAPDEITVTAVEAVEWSDASLGCPQPGYVYAQVITPGYRATVEAGGQTYAVHTDSQGYGLVCPPPM